MEDELKLKVKFEDKSTERKFGEEISLKGVPEDKKTEIRKKFEENVKALADLKLKYGSDDDWVRD